MKRGKRGQVTYEYLVVMGMVLLLVIPFFNYAFSTLGGNMLISSGVAETVQLATVLDEIAYLGPGNRAAVQMLNVERVIISENMITSNIKGKEIAIPSSIYLMQQSLELERGTVVVANIKGRVVATNVPTFTRFSPDPLFELERVNFYGYHITSKKNDEGKITDSVQLHVTGKRSKPGKSDETVDRVYTQILSENKGINGAEDRVVIKLAPHIFPGNYDLRLEFFGGAIYSNTLRAEYEEEEESFKK